MDHLLEDLVIDRVDLVDEGANSAAFIELVKRKEQPKFMDHNEVIAKMSPEGATLIKAELERLESELAKAKEDCETTKRALEEASGKITTLEGELDDEKKKSEAAKASGTGFDEEEMVKSMPEEARAIFLKMKTQKDAAEEMLRKAREAEQHAEAVNKAKELKALPVAEDKLVDLVKSATPEMVETLKAIAKHIDETILEEVGKSTGAGAKEASTNKDSAWGEIEKAAKEVVAKSDGKITLEKAIAQVTTENKELYKAYLEGGVN